MRCTSTRLTAIWQPETRGRFHLPHCPIPGVHFFHDAAFGFEEEQVVEVWCARRTGEREGVEVPRDEGVTNHVSPRAVRRAP